MFNNRPFPGTIKTGENYSDPR